MPFLFRAGLAVLTCVRRTLLDTKGADAVLALLRRPAPVLICNTPDAFVKLALADSQDPAQKALMLGYVREAQRETVSTGDGERGR